MNPKNKFQEDVQNSIKALSNNRELQAESLNWIKSVEPYKYSYNFSWMGRPVIQFPQDMIAMQELIWDIKPDLIIETGIAHGGSLIFYASILELIGKGKIIGIDIDIRQHNREAIESHPMARRIEMIQGSSINPDVAHQVEKRIGPNDTVIVVLDSNHTHDHVLKELELYSPFVSKGSYLMVFDTIIEYMDEGTYKDRPWGKGDNAMTALDEFMKQNDRFEIDRNIDGKLLITAAPKGYLRCVR